MGKVTSIPVKKQEPDYGFSPLGLAIMDALDELDQPTAGEIADWVGEPICVVAAMLKHLVRDGMVNEMPAAKPKRNRR